MPLKDSNSQHASCESGEEAYADENADNAVKQLDINVLMAVLLEEKCVSLEQDGDRGRKLFVDVYDYLRKNGVLKPLSSENLFPKQKEILDKIMKTLAQNVTEEDLPGIQEPTPTTGKYVVQNNRYKNEFDQIGKLGSGGFGTVFEAKHKLDGRSYAVKTVYLENTDMTKPLREVRALAHLKHTNIMGYNTSWVEDESNVSTKSGTSSDESEGSSESTSSSAENACQQLDMNLNHQPVKKDKKRLYIQMELCSRTLQDWLEKRNSMQQNTSDYRPEGLHPDVKHIFCGILSGVIYMHDKGIMHRDLKPQNIFLLGSALHVKIGDFGLAKSVNGNDSFCSSPTVEGTDSIGTELYGSPELLSGKKCNTKCDIYSLGVLRFEILSFFTTDMERVDKIRELRSNSRCPIEFKDDWSQQEVQLIEELINPEADLRPAAEEIRKNPLFDTESEILHQALLQVDQPVDIQKRKMEKPYQKGEKPYLKGEKPYLKGEKPYQKGEKPYQKGEKPYQKSKELVQENAVEWSEEATPDAEFTGLKKKKN